MRLIDADTCWDRVLNGCCYTTEFAIMGTPTIDPVHAAGGCYCRECSYRPPKGTVCQLFGGIITEDDFCSRGQRKEAEQSDAHAPH